MTRIMGFCIGLGAGFAAGVLWAPKRGQETRNLIQNKAEQGLRYAKRRTHQLQRDVSKLKQRSAQMVVGQGEAVRAAVTAGKRAYHRVTG